MSQTPSLHVTVFDSFVHLHLKPITDTAQNENANTSERISITSMASKQFYLNMSVFTAIKIDIRFGRNSRELEQAMISEG